MQNIAQILAFGVVDAAVLAVAAVAFTLQFGVTNYFNFGYGEWLTLGAFVAFGFNNAVLHLNVWLAMLAAGLVTALFSVTLNRALFAPFVARRPDTMYILIMTFGVGFLMNELIQAIWGTDYRQLAYGGDDLHPIGPLQFSTNQLAFLGVSLACMAGTQLILSHTRLGRSMRAVSDNRTLAVICGIKPDRVADATWLMTGFMAGVAGVILAMQIHSFSTDIGDDYVYLIFPAVIIGGIGRAYGALIGALIIGLATAIGVLVIPASVSPLLVFAALVVIIITRPQGLLGGATGRGIMRQAEAA
ncbi:MAG TPA: branched-chain amino acid ABC transporter permease [Chloroflexota bacterium]|nr:branched-chain amino acid ABC transporter permease [Chloroflexota bacterium]